MYKILTIDDESDILFLEESILKNRGFDVVKLSDTTALVEKIDEIKPDLILLDIQMGDVDGRELCKQIKKQRGNKIILCSAHSDLTADFKNYGADGYINKPFTVIELIKKINESLAA